MDIPSDLQARANAVGLRIETDSIPNFAFPDGEPVTVIVTQGGRRTPVFNLEDIETAVWVLENPIN